MTIRWRLSVLGIQLVLLMSVTFALTGQPVVESPWFLAGLLAIVINPSLLEPYYPRPVDVIGNCLVFLFIYFTVAKDIAATAWHFFAIVLPIFAICALFALIFGRKQSNQPLARTARAARMISQIASARVIYSAVFILSAVEYSRTFNKQLWVLTITWVVILVAGVINWQGIWLAGSGKIATATAEGMVGPSTILVSAPVLPPPGTWMELSGHGFKTQGVIINRVRRPDDIWGQIHVIDQDSCEAVLSGQVLNLRKLPKEAAAFLVGSVDAGSTERTLRFTATVPLEVGQVVVVKNLEPPQEVIYQLSGAQVERLEVRGGAHLIVRASANQLGVFDSTTGRFKRHRWVPTPGAPVWSGTGLDPAVTYQPKANDLLLGHIIGTNIPIYLDCTAACDGHLAILGMTKMGKSTLAERLARKLADVNRVTILDQTGEYVNKKGFPSCGKDVAWKDVDWNTAGIAVYEPQPGEVPSERALDFLKFLVEKASQEYKSGIPISRTLIIDEAHQFIPEPAGLGFGVPGRESSIAIGLLMMQIRKYGLSIILISQRTAVVAKSALSQCENLIAFRSVDQTGLDYLEAIAGGEVRNLLPQLNQGEALVFGPALSTDTPVGIHVYKPIMALAHRLQD
jgi:hypothetical protein